MPGATSGFALSSVCLQIRTGGRSWSMGIKGSDHTARTWSSDNYRAAHRTQGPFFHPIDAIRHNHDISRAWMTFILDKSNGFTQAGVERLNDSIRTYVWAILGPAQTRSNILNTGTGFDAQKQFLANIEDATASPVASPAIRKHSSTRARLAKWRLVGDCTSPRATCNSIWAT